MKFAGGSTQERSIGVEEVRLSSRTVLSRAAAAIYTVDRAGRCTQINPAALALMGYTEPECLGRDMHTLIHATRADGSAYPPEECPVYAARIEGRSVDGFNEILWTKGGQPAHVTCSAVPVSRGNDLIGAVVTLFDLTKFQEGATAQQKGTNSSEEVKHSSPELLKQQQKTLENHLLESEKMAAVGRLAASISHEINNPLEAITNLLYLIRHDTEISSKADEYLTQAESELSRVTEIVSQTLRFQRGGSEPTACVPEAVVESVIALQQGKLRNSGIRIDRQHRRSKSFNCSEGDLRQILNNLLSNAIDATRGSGSVITIRTSPGRDVRSGNEGVRISVSDSGHGMTPETQTKIFDPLYTTKGAGGSGLGLWISHSLAKRHGGKLSVRSSKGNGQRGTTFSLFLPHAECADSAQ